MKEEEMMEIADLIHSGLSNVQDPAALAAIKGTVRDFTRRFPLPH
jgi:glycine/serine hydroxymethyltransferase